MSAVVLKCYRFIVLDPSGTSHHLKLDNSERYNKDDTFIWASISVKNKLLIPKMKIALMCFT